jgi:hypothetical protein
MLGWDTNANPRISAKYEPFIDMDDTMECLSEVCSTDLQGSTRHLPKSAGG